MKALPVFAAPDGGNLTATMLGAFEESGVIVLRGFVDKEACANLRAHTVDRVEREAPAEPVSVFSTHSNVQLSDDYFEQSAGNISFFFEEDEANSSDVSRVSRLNKIGHAMHDLDPVFDAFSRTSELARVAACLGFRDPKLVQSMYIFKPPQIGGEVVCHQDSTFLYSEPESCVGFWFAIDDADETNGAMAFIPGAHKGPLRELNARGQDGKLATRRIDDTPFPDTPPVLAPARRGDLVIFHGRTPHMSAMNRSDRPRHAYTLHIVDGTARWPAENWLQRPQALPFRGFDRSVTETPDLNSLRNDDRGAH